MENSESGSRADFQLAIGNDAQRDTGMLIASVEQNGSGVGVDPFVLINNIFLRAGSAMFPRRCAKVMRLVSRQE